MKKAPESFVLTGYMLTKANLKGQKYLDQAQECLTQAIKDQKECDPNSVFESTPEIAKARLLIDQAKAGLRKTKIAHAELRKLSLSLGYDEITDEDFLIHGVGGGR